MLSLGKTPDWVINWKVLQLHWVLAFRCGKAAVQDSWLPRASLGRRLIALERWMLVETEKMSPAGQKLFPLTECWRAEPDVEEVQCFSE